MSILYITLANIFTQALIKQFPKAQNFDSHHLSLMSKDRLIFFICYVTKGKDKYL